MMIRGRRKQNEETLIWIIFSIFSDYRDYHQILIMIIMICGRRKQTKEAFRDDHSNNHDYYQDDENVDLYENYE